MDLCTNKNYFKSMEASNTSPSTPAKTPSGVSSTTPEETKSLTRITRMPHACPIPTQLQPTTFTICATPEKPVLTHIQLYRHVVTGSIMDALVVILTRKLKLALTGETVDVLTHVSHIHNCHSALAKAPLFNIVDPVPGQVFVIGWETEQACTQFKEFINNLIETVEFELVSDKLEH